MPRHSHFCSVLLALVLATSATPALAQTAVTDPVIAEFTPSPDHNTVLSGTPLLARYELQFFVLGTAQPSQVVNLGKPAPDPDGKIRVNFTPLLTSWPAAGVVHEARVVAVGSNGVGTSTPSNTFVFTAQCGASLSPVSVSVGPASSTGNVVVSAAAGCAWTAASDGAWLTVTSGATGNGSGTVGYAIAANTSSSARTATLTIAGQPFTVTQAAGCSFAVSPTASVVAAAATTGSVSVAAGAGCAWSAGSSAPWVTIVSGAPGTGNGSVTYSVAANTSASTRTATLTVAGSAVTITQEGVACTYAISPMNASLDADAATGSVAVTSATGCAWTASSGVPWITVTSGASGSANGQVRYSVAANTSTAPRTGTVTIAGHVFSVTQAGVPCSFAISPIGTTVGAGATTGTVSMSTAGGCSWSATSAVPWLTISSGGSGSGAGTVTYSVSANTSAASRTGSLTVGGQTFTVTQAGVSCTSTISPTSADVSASAAQGSVAVTTPAGCTWTASSATGWLSVTGGSSGSGSGAVTYAATANAGTAARTGSLTIAGHTFTVTQSGVPCSYTVNPTTASVGAAASTAGVSVTAAAGCAWTATSSAPWITVAPASGAGTGSVDYSVAQNTSTLPRSGLLTIAGQTVTITQAGGCGYGVSPASASVGAASSTGAITVSAGAACAWTASSAVPWVSFTTASGTGPGAANYSVSANPDSSSRSTTLTVAGQSIVLTQAGASCDYSVTPVSQSVVAAGGNAGISVTAPGGCAWTAAPSVSWISITSGGSGAGSGTVAYSVEANAAATIRSGTIAVGGRLVTISQAGVTCSSTLTPTARAFEAAGGTDVVSITQPAGCIWTAISGASWIRVTSAASGSGSGGVTYTVSANTAETARTGTMTIAGRTFTVTQGGTCSATISPNSVSAPAEASAGTIDLATGSACSWTASSSVPWLTITGGASGTGAGAVSYAIEANTGITSRMGTITAGGRIFTVSQAASACTYLMSPTSVSLTAAATTRTVQVVAGSACAWTAGSSAPWITVTGGATGSGPGTVTFSVAANPAITPRSGTVTIAGQNVTVAQAGLTCSFTVAPIAVSLSPAAATSSLAVTGLTGCGWTASANVPWITITSGAAGDGSGTVNYSVAQNTSGFARSGTITAAGRLVSVAQAGNSCIIALSNIGVSVGPAPGTASVNVSTGASCSWTTTSGVAWIGVSAGASGTGNGTVVLDIAENTSTASRMGVVAIGGRSFTVTQSGSCQYTVSPTGAMLGGYATTAYVWVSAGLGCAWTASSNDSWATVNTASGQGTGLVSYTLAANPSTTPRSTTLSIAGSTVAVTQAGAICTYSVSPITLPMTTGGTRTITVTAPTGCAWQATSGASWITIEDGAGGNGAGTVTLQMTPNTGFMPRLGIVTVAGWRIAVTQTVQLPPPSPKNPRIVQ